MEGHVPAGGWRGLFIKMAKRVAHWRTLRRGISPAGKRRNLSMVPRAGQSCPRRRGRDRQMVRNVYRYRESETEPTDSGRADFGADDAVGGSQHAPAGRND